MPGHGVLGVPCVQLQGLLEGRQSLFVTSEVPQRKAPVAPSRGILGVQLQSLLEGCQRLLKLANFNLRLTFGHPVARRSAEFDDFFRSRQGPSVFLALRQASIITRTRLQSRVRPSTAQRFQGRLCIFRVERKRATSPGPHTQLAFGKPAAKKLHEQPKWLSALLLGRKSNPHQRLLQLVVRLATFRVPANVA